MNVHNLPISIAIFIIAINFNYEGLIEKRIDKLISGIFLLVIAGIILT